MKMQVTLSAEEVRQALGSEILAAVGLGWRFLDMGRTYIPELIVEMTNDPPETTVEEKEFESCQR